MRVVMAVGPAEQMHGAAEIDMAFGADILQHLGLEQAVDDLVSGRARRVDHPGDVADAHRRTMLEQRLQEHDDPVDATAPVARRAVRLLDRTCVDENVVSQIHCIVVSRRLNKVKAVHSIPFVRYTDWESEISDTTVGSPLGEGGLSCGQI